MSIVGHRGDYKIENTLQSFKNAWMNGIKIVECDIRLSENNMILISHDNCLKKSSNQKIKINQTNWEDIKDIVLINGHNIPLLIDLLKLANELETFGLVKGHKIIIEMKNQ